MKIIKTTIRAKSYQEVCSILEETPRPRGEPRQKHMEEIGRFYKIVKKKNNSYVLNLWTKELREIESGQRVMVDNKMVNLHSPFLFCETGIQRYIDYRIIQNASNKFHKLQTKQAFVCDCFCRSKLFLYLLSTDSQLFLKNYSLVALDIVDDFTTDVLYHLVLNEIKRLQSKGIVVVEEYFVDNNMAKIPLSKKDEKEITNKALSYAGCGNLKQVFTNAPKRQKYIEERDRLIFEKTKRIVKLKKFSVNFSPAIPRKDYESYCKQYFINTEESQEILTNFFDTLRAKLCWTIKEKAKAEKNILKLNRFDGASEAIKIIQEYCAYTNAPPNLQAKRWKTFYSVAELHLWQCRNKEILYSELEDDYPMSYGKFNLYRIQDYLADKKYML